MEIKTYRSVGMQAGLSGVILERFILTAGSIFGKTKDVEQYYSESGAAKTLAVKFKGKNIYNLVERLTDKQTSNAYWKRLEKRIPTTGLVVSILN